jgi:hypothetical protein
MAEKAPNKERKRFLTYLALGALALFGLEAVFDE